MTPTPGAEPASGSALLRFATIGSVDDGKSTLIGRLLHDTKQLFDDQLEAVASASRRHGTKGVDLAFVTDGLRAEREQGITIDVAYRYASTPRRKFVIADCPGHVQYTRNMATGASTADLAVVVVDATAGLREQTRRHACIAALLGVRHLLVAANKMDLADWSEAAYQSTQEEIDALALRLGMETVVIVPVSALLGDNVVEPSTHMPWYTGPTLLNALEEAPAGAWAGEGAAGARLPVQWVVRHPGGGRSYAGMVSGGTFRPGDGVVVLPSGQTSRLTSVETFDGPLDEASASLSVTLRLDDDLDVSRGDLIASAESPPEVVREFEATLCWFADVPIEAGRRFRVKHTTRLTPSQVVSVDSRLDIGSLELEPTSALRSNDIGVVRLAVGTPLAVDPYRANRVTGSFVVIDEQTNATVAAGMVGTPVLAALPQGVTVGVGAPIYPVGLVVKGRRCLVVGGGRVAARKIAGLLACGAAVTVVAPEVHVAIGDLTDTGAIAAIDEPPLDVQIRQYTPGEAADYLLVITATGVAEVDDVVYHDAQAAGIWINVADDPARCSFVLPAVARDGAVSIAVSTAGASPALAGWLRDLVVEALGPGMGDLAALLDEGRRRVHDQGKSTETLDWRALLDGPLPDLVRQGQIDAARATLDAFLSGQDTIRATPVAPRDLSPGRETR